MRSFELSRNRRINMWLDEAPPANFTTSSTLTRLVQSKVVINASRRIAAIEAMIPHGPMASYALLGAELVESNTNDGLQVVVSVNSHGFPFTPSLALKPDIVNVGLLDEYAHAVVAGVEDVAKAIGVPTRSILQFRWAAHGLVGSSPLIFREISNLVVQLLILPRNASDRELEALFG